MMRGYNNQYGFSNSANNAHANQAWNYTLCGFNDSYNYQSDGLWADYGYPGQVQN